MRKLNPVAALLIASSAFAASPRTVLLQIQKMTCETCPIVVRKALERLPGVNSVHVDFRLKTATVQFDPDKVTPEMLSAAAANAGFPSTTTR